MLMHTPFIIAAAAVALMRGIVTSHGSGIAIVKFITRFEPTGPSSLKTMIVVAFIMGFSIVAIIHFAAGSIRTESFVAVAIVVVVRVSCGVRIGVVVLAIPTSASTSWNKFSSRLPWTAPSMIITTTIAPRSIRISTATNNSSTSPPSTAIFSVPTDDSSVMFAPILLLCQMMAAPRQIIMAQRMWSTLGQAHRRGRSTLTLGSIAGGNDALVQTLFIRGIPRSIEYNPPILTLHQIHEMRHVNVNAALVGLMQSANVHMVQHGADALVHSVVLGPGPALSVLTVSGDDFDALYVGKLSPWIVVVAF